ncbi:hypothetical protein KUTeg_023484, partial [Tegillarca granosa]
MLAVSVSNIAYLRAIFPEHAFGDRCLEDLGLKILRDDSSCPGACQVIKWVKGCFDALDKKYTVIESYTFKFSYNNHGGMDIYRNDKKVSSAYSEAETKKATIRLLRTIVVLTQNLDSLPDDVMMTMKLFVKMRIRTDRKQFEVREDNVEGEDTKQTDQVSDNHEDRNMETDQVYVAIPTESPAKPGCNDTAVDTTGSQKSQVSTAEQEDFGVRCPCGCNEDDGLMILCAICKYWQHGICFLIQSEDEAPDHHVCDVCAVPGDQDNHPTDAYLCNLSSIAVQATCLWRRALLAVSEMNRVLAPNLAKRLGTEITVAQGVINRLEKEGFIKNQGKGK